MDETDKRARAIRAQQLIDDEVLASAINNIEADAISHLASADLSDGSELRHHTARLQAVRALREELHSIIMTGMSNSRPSPTVA